MNRFWTIVLPLLFTVVLQVDASARQSPTDLLESINQNVEAFRQLLPDFICSEKITSAKFGNVFTGRQVIVESLLRGRQEKNGKGLSFVESREIKRINGQPAPSGAAMPDLPYFLGGGFSSLLMMTFSKENLEYHDYKLLPRQGPSGEPLLIEFSTKKNQKKLQTHWGDRLLAQNDTGKAWIDPASKQVVRIERHYLNLPSEWRSSSSTVEYARVNIDGKPFWMPKTVKSELTSSNRRDAREYIAEYSGCLKFEISVGIHYD